MDHAPAGRRDASTTRCTAPGPTRSPRRSTSRATSAPTTPRSTSSAAARCRRSPSRPRACRTPPSGSCDPSKDYSWSSVVDHMGVEQAVGIWGGSYRGRDVPAARGSCGATSRSPTAAMHEGGPYSEIAARIDPRQRRPHRRGARRGRARRRVRRHRVRPRRRPRHGGDRTPTCSGDWDVALAPPASRTATRPTCGSTRASPDRRVTLADLTPALVAPRRPRRRSPAATAGGRARRRARRRSRGCGPATRSPEPPLAGRRAPRAARPGSTSAWSPSQCTRGRRRRRQVEPMVDDCR